MQTEYVEPKLFNKICGLLPHTSALAIRLSLETGLRIGDVLSAKPEHLKKNQLSFVAQKTKKAGTVMISDKLLKEIRANASPEWLFPSPQKAGEHLTRQAVWFSIRKACQKLEIKGVIAPHSARKTFAVEDRKKNGIAHTRQALQHKSTETTKIYAYSDLYEMDGIQEEIKAIHADVRRIYQIVAEFKKPLDKTKKT